MIELSFEQKQDLGLKYLMDLLRPATPFGAERLKRQRFYAPEERAELEAELDNVALLCAAMEGERDAVAALEHAMSRVKDVRGSLRTCRQGTLGEIELFQVNAFLNELRRIIPLARALTVYPQLNGAELSDVDAPLEILDPGHSGKLTFYIEDTRTPELFRLRREKQAVEIAINTCPPAERPEQMTRRLAIVKAEELELSRIYEDMSLRLRPHLEALLANTEALAVLDAAMQKAWLARRFPSVKPRVGAAELRLTDAVSPMVAEALAERERRFTPISLDMPKGVTVLTGANMGGKSVAMQTVTLNVCLALMGFYVFCAAAEVPLFDRIELINRDFASAEGGLSSFGGEIDRFNRAAARLNGTDLSLIIMDEFARGTNCDEGAAIIRAVVRWLDGKNAFTLLATHYDGTAEYASAHYQVKGLSRMPEQTPGPGVDRLRAIADSMDYGLIPVSADSPCPKDAVKICRLLGMEPEILRFITKLT